MVAQRRTTVDHRKKILDPDSWPAWPVLPLKRPAKRQGDVDTGFLLGSPRPGEPYIVNLGNMYDMPMPKEQFDAMEKKSYDTVDALLADGWEVD